MIVDLISEHGGMVAYSWLCPNTRAKRLRSLWQPAHYSAPDAEPSTIATFVGLMYILFLLATGCQFKSDGAAAVMDLISTVHQFSGASTATATGTQIKIEWNAASPIQSVLRYEVYDVGADGAQINGIYYVGSNTTSYTYTNTTSEPTKRFIVNAIFKNYGPDGNTKVVQATSAVNPTKSYAFAGATRAVNIGGTKIRVEWNAPANTDDLVNYELYDVADDGVSINSVKHIPASESSYTIENLAHYTRKNFKVRAVFASYGVDGNNKIVRAMSFPGISTATFISILPLYLKVGVGSIGSNASKVSALKVYVQYDDSPQYVLAKTVEKSESVAIPIDGVITEVPLATGKVLTGVRVRAVDSMTLQEDSNEIFLAPKPLQITSLPLIGGKLLRVKSVADSSKDSVRIKGHCLPGGPPLAVTLPAVFTSTSPAGEEVEGSKNCLSDGTFMLELRNTPDNWAVWNSFQTITVSQVIGGITYSDSVSVKPGEASALCPTNYLAIEGNSTMGIGTVNFCIAKFEMKATTDGSHTGDTLANGGNGNFTYVPNTYLATSRPDGTPWVNISRNNAAIECERLNPSPNLSKNYRLLSNAEWQTLARNIEKVPANWSDNAVGTGTLNRGHSDNIAPTIGAITDGLAFSGTYYALAAASSSILFDDSNGYVGTGNTTGEQKRTHTLSTGDIIWDVAGNVWEWISDNISGGSLTPALGAAWHEYTSTASFPTSDTDPNRLLFAPFDQTYDSIKGVGQIYGGTGGAVLRGGSWYYEVGTGVFAAYLNCGPTYTNINFGFRCAFAP